MLGLTLINPSKRIDELRLKRLHTKILEGAADVYSLIVFRRIHPDDTIRIAQALVAERFKAWREAKKEGVAIAMGTYDNADCILRLIDTPWLKWPTNQNECSVFSWRHSMPYLRRARVLQNHQEMIDSIEQALPNDRPWMHIGLNMRKLNQTVEFGSTASPQFEFKLKR